MSHFYLTLPSNSSSKYFPNNTLTHFVTKLHNDVSLNGEWEVALVDIMYPQNWYNVIGQYIDVSLSHTIDIQPEITPQEGLSPSYEHRVEIPSGYYGSMRELVKVLNASINDTFDKVIPSWCSESISRYLKPSLRPSFSHDAQDREVSVKMPMEVYVDLSEKLAEILGMNAITEEDAVRQRNGEMITKNYKPYDVGGGLHTLYIYCDVLESIPVGDTMAPLLRIVEVSGTRNDERQELTHVQYDQPRYFPVQKKAFDTIEIDIRDDTGESIPFDAGKLIVTLHFRRAKDSYFIG